MVAIKQTSPDAGKAVNQETYVQVEEERDSTGLEKEVRLLTYRYLLLVHS